MAWRRIAPLVLVAGLGGCGAVPDPPPRPTPPPEARVTERQGDLKAASWRSAAAAEAARLARLRATIRTAHRSTSVAGALRYALLTARISPETHARLSRDYKDARRSAARLTGARASELWYVISVVDSLAAQHLLTPGRLRPAFLILHRNAEFWTHEPFPAAAQRITFNGDPAVFQYYPGRGMQLQPLASWGKVNWLAGKCAQDNAFARRRTACPFSQLRRTVDRLLSLAAPRGGFLAWEYYFSWGGGTPPWISGMTQATAVSALARASRALDEPRWRRAAHRALGVFTTPPPVGVDGGDHYVMYSFSPSLRVFNGELQAVSGIGQMAAMYPSDRLAGRLFRRGERTARGMIPLSDTGAWSLYSLAGREATLGYHQLIEGFFSDMCHLTLRRIYCSAHDRFARYEREPTKIAIAPLRKLRARRLATVHFSISKVSDVSVRVWSKSRLTYVRDLELPHGAHAVDWTPPWRGRYHLRITAQGPSGPLGVESRNIRVVLPKPKPKKHKKPRKQLTPRPQDETVDG